VTRATKDERTAQQWRASTAIAAAAFVAILISMLIFPKYGRSLAIAWASLAVFSGLNLALLLIFRRARSAALATVSLVAICLAALTGIWINHEFFIGAPKPFQYFFGHKLLALGLGFVAPPAKAVTAILLFLTGAASLIQYFHWDPALRATLPIQEPWQTIITVAVSAVIYGYRLHASEVARRAAELETRTDLLQKFAHLLLTAQHLANTPLQTIENTTAVLRTRNPELEPQLAPIERSLTRIRETVRLFTRCDSLIDWSAVELPESNEDFERRLRELVGKPD
jgi:hypothetical protein